MRRVYRSAQYHNTNPEEDAKIVDSVIYRFIETGVLNDRHFAQMRANTLYRKGNSSRLIRSKLIEKGVTNEIISEVLATLLNNGGIRSIISQGPVSEKTAFELMPFENSIVIVKLDGNSIKKMVDYLVKVRLPHPIKGLEIILNKDYSVESVLLNNNTIDENKNYFVATTDYLLDGGDKMYFLAESKETTIIDYKMRDVLIDYFIKTDTLKLKTDNRFIIN